VILIERRCRITGVENPIHLVASHCKPWHDSTNEERLNGENCLLSTPGIDHMFGGGIIGFEDFRRMPVSRRFSARKVIPANLNPRVQNRVCASSICHA
jgi:hypothetical protein